MRDQGLEAGQEEEDKERNQDFAKSFGWTKYCRLTRCRQRSSGSLSSFLSVSARAVSDIRIDEQSKTPSLIFEYINNTDFRSLYPKFQDYDVRYYIFELLKVGAPKYRSDELFSC